jgi:hypothetical protein
MDTINITGSGDSTLVSGGGSQYDQPYSPVGSQSSAPAPDSQEPRTADPEWLAKTSPPGVFGGSDNGDSSLQSAAARAAEMVHGGASTIGPGSRTSRAGIILVLGRAGWTPVAAAAAEQERTTGAAA